LNHAQKIRGSFPVEKYYSFGIKTFNIEVFCADSPIIKECSIARKQKTNCRRRGPAVFYL